MFYLIPASIHRAALNMAHRVRHVWRGMRGVTGEGVSVIGHDIDGQILLVRHSYGPQSWYFPGGGMRKNETPEDAAVREMREETNCDIDNLQLVGVIEEELSGAPHKAYLFHGVVDASPVPDGREVVEARFFPTHSLPEPLSPQTKTRLKMWQSRKA